MIERINEAIEKLKTSTKESDIKLLIQSKILSLGYQNYNEKFLEEVKENFPEYVRFYEKGKEIKEKENIVGFG